MRALGLAIGWLMVAAILWLSLTPSPPRLEVAPSWATSPPTAG
jgi:hypothetical protein